MQALLFYITCTSCIANFSSLLRVCSVCLSHHTLSPFSNKAGLLAWMYTCQFHLHVAGWVGPLPYLSFHLLLGGACTSLVGSSVTLQGVSLPPSLLFSLLLGCVAATFLARTLRGVLPPLPFYARGHPTTCSPSYCQILCSRS